MKWAGSHHTQICMSLFRSHLKLHPLGGEHCPLHPLNVLGLWFDTRVIKKNVFCTPAIQGSD